MDPKNLSSKLLVGDGIWFLTNRIYRIEVVALSLVTALTCFGISAVNVHGDRVSCFWFLVPFFAFYCDVSDALEALKSSRPES